MCIGQPLPRWVNMLRPAVNRAAQLIQRWIAVARGNVHVLFRKH
jgi:hypothetical protein